MTRLRMQVGLLPGTTDGAVAGVARAAARDEAVAASWEVLAMLDDCAERPAAYVHATAFCWGCCHDSTVSDEAAARAALEAFVTRLREAWLVGPKEPLYLEAES